MLFKLGKMNVYSFVPLWKIFTRSLLKEEMVRKSGKVLCCMCLFPILGVDRAQNLTKYKRWLRVFMQLTNRNIAIMLFVHSV